MFALAYLLGIKLMPRIRNWQDLTLCRPDKQVRYDHIDELFTDVIDWKLIETHLPDMMRVILSIKSGKFTASTILRKLRAKTVAGVPPVEVIGEDRNIQP